MHLSVDSCSRLVLAGRRRPRRSPRRNRARPVPRRAAPAPADAAHRRPTTPDDDARAATTAAAATAAPAAPTPTPRAQAHRLRAPPPKRAPPRSPPTKAPARPRTRPRRSHLRFERLRADYDRLRDELFRARSRAQIVEEGLWNSRLGATLPLEGRARLPRAPRRRCASTAPNLGLGRQARHRRHGHRSPSGRCKPGPARADAADRDPARQKKKARTSTSSATSSEHTFAIIVPDGKRTTRRDQGRRGRRAARVRAADRARARTKRSRSDRGALVTCCWLSSPTRPRAALRPRSRCPGAAKPRRPIPMARYLTDLEKSGVLADDRRARDDRCRSERDARRRRERPGHGQPAGGDDAPVPHRRGAALRSSSPTRPSTPDAELTLGRALVRAGAYESAERYLLRALAHGAEVTLLRARLPRDGRHRARDARAGRDPGACSTGEAALEGRPAPRQRERARVPRAARSPTRRTICRAPRRTSATSTASRASSRRRCTSAASSHARKGHSRWRAASLCEIVEQVDQDRFSFFIDGRYYAIKDLAYLALGRISHEQGKYDDAYYFYFRVPEDSERLPDALFEASWSMFQKQEYEAAGAFLDQFDRSFPKSPLAPDVLLLHAMIDLKSCQFEQVRAELEELVTRLQADRGRGPGADQGSGPARASSTSACSASSRSAAPATRSSSC